MRQSLNFDPVMRLDRAERRRLLQSVKDDRLDLYNISGPAGTKSRSANVKFLRLALGILNALVIIPSIVFLIALTVSHVDEHYLWILPQPIHNFFTGVVIVACITLLSGLCGIIAVLTSRKGWLITYCVFLGILLILSVTWLGMFSWSAHDTSHKLGDVWNQIAVHAPKVVCSTEKTLHCSGWTLDCSVHPESRECPKCEGLPMLDTTCGPIITSVVERYIVACIMSGVFGVITAMMLAVLTFFATR